MENGLTYDEIDAITEFTDCLQHPIRYVCKNGTVENLGFGRLKITYTSKL